MRIAHLLTTLGCALLLTGCGIKGPLYLPEIPEAPASQLSASDHNKTTTNDRR